MNAIILIDGYKYVVDEESALELRDELNRIFNLPVERPKIYKDPPTVTTDTPPDES